MTGKIRYQVTYLGLMAPRESSVRPAVLDRLLRPGLVAPISIAVFASIIAPPQRCGTHCGTERWPVKTLTDADAADVNFNPSATSVADLRGLTKPTIRPANGRVGPTELTTFRVHALLIGWKIENSDRDMRLIIADPGNPTQTMIAEIPSPTCSRVCNSVHSREFEAARAALINQLGSPSSNLRTLSPPPRIIVTGVGFFDFLHGQRGSASNGIELHPVLEVVF